MTVTTDISNYADTLDTLDIIERLDDINAALENFSADYSDKQERNDWLLEQKTLTVLLEEVGDESCHGVTLIRDSYFKTYAMELADEIGAYDRDLKWPLTCIDWDQAARELRYDYTSVDYDGVTYWFQS